MLKRFSHFFACLLLVLMPLQAIAAANMLVCNSLMQATKSAVNSAVNSENAKSMPCHQHKVSQLSDTKQHGANHQDQQKSPCKTNCVSICANLCALTALSNQVKPSLMQDNTQAIDFNHQIYVSVTQVSPQRPPNFFI